MTLISTFKAKELKTLILLFVLSSVTLSASALESNTEAYVGIYSWQGAARFRVYLQDSTNQLMISISEVGVFPLINAGEDAFELNISDANDSDDNKRHQIVFGTKDGKATSIAWNLPSGKQFSGKRIKKLDKYAIDVDSQLNQSLETDDFEIWYTPQDSIEAKAIFQSFQNNYKALRTKFQLTELEKISIRIYPNKSHYAIGINLPDRISSLLSATEYGPSMIMMLSPRTLIDTPYYEMTISKGVLHELVHVLHRNYSDNAFNTGWLYEGVAIYTTKCCHDYQPQDIKYFKKRKHLSFKKINSDMMMKKKYEAGPFIVEFIDQVYGWDTLISLMKNDANFEQALGKSEAEVENEFYTYLENKYF